MKRLEKLNIRDVRHLCKTLGTEPKELEAFTDNIEPFYRRKTRVKNGKTRELATPVGRLRTIVDCLNRFLQRVELPDYIHGGRRGHSYLTNAAVHQRKPTLLVSDIANFFPSIPCGRVYDLFANKLGCVPDVARHLTRLTTLDGHVPQGSPTSTIVAVLVAAPLSRRVAKLAKSHRADFSQYVDDLSVSGPSFLERIQPTIERVIRQERFPINRKKTKVRTQRQEQVVTGVRLNAGLDVPKKRLWKLRDAINDVESKLERGCGVSDRAWRSLEGKARAIKTLNLGCGRFYMRRIRKMRSLSVGAVVTRNTIAGRKPFPWVT